MFGYPASFVNGNMFAGLFQDEMFLRLNDTDRAAIRKQYGTQLFEPMPGRPMRGYVLVPRYVLKSPRLLREWLNKGMEYAKSLPAKKSRIKKD
jgi:TfoX/Sxy family transcriptional regulator of competence genes